jgi:hypothetical protein
MAGPSYVLNDLIRYLKLKRPQYFQGTNAYWLPQLTVPADVDTVFKDMQKGGVKVVRTWARLLLDKTVFNFELILYQAFSSINATQVGNVGDLTYYQVRGRTSVASS